jgi:hypothetical protein
MGGQAIIGSARLIIYPKDILSVEGGRFERWRLGSLNLPRDGAEGRPRKEKDASRADLAHSKTQLASSAPLLVPRFGSEHSPGPGQDLAYSFELSQSFSNP